MAITLDSTTDGGTATATTLTFSHTIATNSYLVVGVGITAASSDYITGVTFNGNAMSRILFKDEGTEAQAWLYGLYVSAGVTANVVITSASSQSIRGGAISYTLASRSNATGNSSGNSTTPSGSVTTTIDNEWAVMVLSNNSGTADNSGLTGGVNRVSRANFAMYDTNAPKTPAGAVTFSNITIPSGRWAVALGSIVPGVLVDIPVTNDTNATTDSVVYGLGITPTDTNENTDSVSFATWENQPKSTAPTWTNQSKS